MSQQVRLFEYRDRREEYLAASPPPSPPPAPGMVWIPGGDYLAGSDQFYPEERPVRRVHVEGFWLDCTPVTNEAFAEFCRQTGYRTTAERPLRYDNIDLPPHGLVFRRQKGPVSLDNAALWWRMVEGANWRAPRGPNASRPSRFARHPVVQVSYQDACAFAEWAGKSLPSEAQWEFAARSGLDGAVFAWGNRDKTEGREALANRWHGDFPYRNKHSGGYAYTTPVEHFAVNGYGLHDMIGNVWEWTSTSGSESAASQNVRSCCGSRQVEGNHGSRVLKGGSHLCAPNYCFRYRPAARLTQDVDACTSHIGFRCVLTPG